MAEMSGPKRPRPKCPWPKCPTFLLCLCHGTKNDKSNEIENSACNMQTPMSRYICNSYLRIAILNIIFNYSNKGRSRSHILVYFKSSLHFYTHLKSSESAVKKIMANVNVYCSHRTKGTNQLK